MIKRWNAEGLVLAQLELSDGDGGGYDVDELIDFARRVKERGVKTVQHAEYTLRATHYVDIDGGGPYLDWRD
jgi:hypothetical protein